MSFWLGFVWFCCGLACYCLSRIIGRPCQLAEAIFTWPFWLYAEAERAHNRRKK